MDWQGGILVQDILLWDRSFVRDGVTENEIRAVVAEEHVLPAKRKRRLAVYEDNQGRLRVKAYQGHGEDIGASIDDSQALREINSVSELERPGYMCCLNKELGVGPVSANQPTTADTAAASSVGHNCSAASFDRPFKC